MRPLPIQGVSGTPPFVLGLSVIRGAPVPVVDLDLLLGGGRDDGRATRFVTVRVNGRQVALAVPQVIGVVEVDADAMAAVPPLVAGARSEFIAAIGERDGQLLWLLQAGRVIPEEVWRTLLHELPV